ncbi:MAG: radical SAM protein [Bacteroidetes bacterium]|nr:radical SAM protein [Bacteroidota bacterium]
MSKTEQTARDEDLTFRIPLEREIKKLFRVAFRVSLFRFSFFFFVISFIQKQRKAYKLRMVRQGEGVNVPPFMIVSVTHSCNLHCSGCYSKVNHTADKPDMSDNDLLSILKQAEELGTSIALLSGGEPLKRSGLFSITREFPGMLFPLFTNGLLIDDSYIEIFRQQSNIVPIISLEGTEFDTDNRRGSGVHSRVLEVLESMKQHRVFFGVSFTVTKENVMTITDSEYVRELMRLGVYLFFYNEYVPFEPGSESKCVSVAERDDLEKSLILLRKQFNAMFISFPGDEAQFGGCLSAGRGFFHINPAGEMEPCPFSPYSTDSLKEVSLKEALQSKFLSTIRENHDKLFEYQSGCALWNNKEWVEKLVEENKS